ncbi:MAG TPA: hypothetical protein VFB27_02900 [Opitutaceae bacterium]|nr:hypothetical protein [Opitutaceae bacterium]
MNTQCIQCHTEFPILTEFGRQFKLSGYTMAQNDTDLPPLAVMLQPSFTHTAKSQPGGAAPGFGSNNNWALSQASIFYSGRVAGPYADRLLSPEAAAVANKFGIFFQTTYDGGAKSWSWDNAELRFADSGTLASSPLTYGIYLNNNPTLQDPWNSTPAWGFPFSGSKLAPTPTAATLIDGGLAQQVAGLGAYAMWANAFYFDVAGYRTLGRSFQKFVGIDPAGETQIAGVAPYWRAAFIQSAGEGVWELGTFGLATNAYPGRDSSAGHDQISDVGLDSEYQISAGRHDTSVLVSYIHEYARWSASRVLSATSKASGSLGNLKVTLADLYDKTYGATAQYFIVDGGGDALRYSGSANGSPRSDGFILQADYLPFNKGGGPAFWPRSNVKITLQYVLYNRFDGARTNFDGTGRNAPDNDTLYLETWIDF